MAAMAAASWREGGREDVAALMVKERQAGDGFWEITGFLRIFGLRR